jgi:hypothetical protein
MTDRSSLDAWFARTDALLATLPTTDPHKARTCPSCGGSQYRCLRESFGSTGSLRAVVEWRHDSSGYIGCPRA